MAEETERIYVIPLKNKGYISSKAAPTAMKRVKQYLTKHMKVAESDIWIDESLNKAIWSRGKYKMPGKIRVKAVRFEDGVVEAYLPELEFTKSRREILQEEREKKQPILRREEEVEEAEEGEMETGAEDYDVVPGPDGEVKIKKKKSAKKEEEEQETEEEEGEEEEETAAESEQDTDVDEIESEEAAEETEEEEKQVSEKQKPSEVDEKTDTAEEKKETK